MSRSKRPKLSEGDEEVRLPPAFRRGWKFMRGTTVDYIQHTITSALANTLPQVKNAETRSQLSESTAIVIRRMREEFPKTAAPSSSYRPVLTQLPDIVNNHDDQVLKASDQVKTLRLELEQQERALEHEEQAIADMERQLEAAQESARRLQGDRDAGTEPDEGEELVLESMPKPLDPPPASVTALYDEVATKMSAVYSILAPAMEYASIVHAMALSLEPTA